MNLLIDIGHPAHVHLFKHTATEMKKNGHRILFTVRDKDNAAYLLFRYRLEFARLGTHFKSKKGKIWGMLTFNYRLLRVALRFKPDILLSHGSMYAAQVSRLIRKPHVSLEDTGNMEQIRLYRPFTDAILTSTSFKTALGPKQLFYEGYHELAYLHPNRFQPNASIRSGLCRQSDRPYAIVRFVSWEASHDFGHPGISLTNKIRAIESFAKTADVYISSEGELPPELEAYRLPVAPESMHDALAFATLLYGESATMASESAMLGVPAIYLDNKGRYYTRELEKKYGMVFNFTESPEDQERSIRKGVEILQSPRIRDEWQQRREKMLADRIDVTAFLVWFLETYPESAAILNQNPDYSKRFK
ncbi:MAG: DUF354 domain-containing protein [Candidatus Omnitrophota bacterium]